MDFLTIAQYLKTTKKSLIFESEASYVNIQKTSGYTFLPLKKLLQILGNSAYLRYKKNHQDSEKKF